MRGWHAQPNPPECRGGGGWSLCKLNWAFGFPKHQVCKISLGGAGSHPNVGDCYNGGDTTTNARGLPLVVCQVESERQMRWVPPFGSL